MHRRFARACCLSLVALALGGCAAASRLGEERPPFLSYAVTLGNLDLRVLHVRGVVYGASLAEVPLGALAVSGDAAWEPISFVAADLAGGALRVTREGARYVVENRRKDFTFDYDVTLRRGDPASPDIRGRVSYFGDDRCRMLARDVLLVPEVAMEDGILVDVSIWPGAPVVSSSASVRHRIIVSDRGELASTLAIAGGYRALARTVGTTTLVLAAAGSWSFEDEELLDVTCRIVATEVAMFGTPRRERYLFVLDRNPVQGEARFDYYGLHEGGNIVLLIDPRLDRSQLIDTPMSIIAHEFLHNWNGEMLRPASNDFLWFTEGVTTYLSHRVLLDAGIITERQYAAHAAAVAERYRGNPLRATVAIGEAGNSDMGDKNRVSLLYDGGFVAARALDRRLAVESAGRCTLVDVLRDLCARAGERPTIDEAGFAAAVRQRCGVEIEPFLNTIVHTPAPPFPDEPSL